MNDQRHWAHRLDESITLNEYLATLNDPAIEVAAVAWDAAGRTVVIHSRNPLIRRIDRIMSQIETLTAALASAQDAQKQLTQAIQDAATRVQNDIAALHAELQQQQASGSPDLSTAISSAQSISADTQNLVNAVQGIDPSSPPAPTPAAESAPPTGDPSSSPPPQAS